MQKICVIGLGYVGLPTAAILAQKGYEVSGYDTNLAVVEALNRGKVIITEPGLAKLVSLVASSGQLTACSTAQSADVYIITVPTPFTGHKKPDLSYVDAAVGSIIELLTEDSLVILGSTAPVGTTTGIAKRIYDARPKLAGKLAIAYCPERVLPGKIIREFIENDRIVGGVDERSTTKARDFYRAFVSGTVWQTNSHTAEMCKLTENAYRDVNIAFANELSMICAEIGVNVYELIRLANHHPRVNILAPGPGVGGHCVAVDPWFIVERSPKSANLIKMARSVNDAKPEFVARNIAAACENIVQPIIACLGLAFKADINDYRESPAIKVIRRLEKLIPNAKIIATDPYIAELPEKLTGFANIKFMSDYIELCKMATHIAILTDHSVYRKMDKALFKTKTLIDTRGTFAKQLVL